jgi:hypothetical protein
MNRELSNLFLLHLPVRKTIASNSLNHLKNHKALQKYLVPFKLASHSLNSHKLNFISKTIPLLTHSVCLVNLLPSKSILSRKSTSYKSVCIFLIKQAACLEKVQIQVLNFLESRLVHFLKPTITHPM